MSNRAHDTATPSDRWNRMIASTLNQRYPGRCEEQVTIGLDLYADQPYSADFLVHDPSGDLIISLRWQEEPGDEEEEVIYQIASLANLVRTSGTCRKAYLVLGGPGFSSGAKSFLFRQRHRDLILHGDLVEVISSEDFLAHAGKGSL